MKKHTWHLKFKIFYYLLEQAEQKQIDDFVETFTNTGITEKLKLLSLIKISPSQLSKNTNINIDSLIMAYDTLEAIYYLSDDKTLSNPTTRIYLNNDDYLKSTLFRELLSEITLKKLQINSDEKHHFFGILSNCNIIFLKENLLPMGFTEQEIFYLANFSEIFKFFKSKY